MTREEFHQRFRGRMLLILTEAWAARRCSPTELGRLVDEHAVSIRHLLGEMWDELNPPPVRTPAPETPIPGALQRPPGHANGRK